MDAAEQLQRLNMVLEVARANGNQLFIDNIEREIAALESGEVSPIVQDYLTEEERGWRGWMDPFESHEHHGTIDNCFDFAKAMSMPLLQLQKKRLDDLSSR